MIVPATNHVLQIHGVHAPNVPLSAYRETVDGPIVCPAAFWKHVIQAQAGWVKFLWPEHSPCDTALAKALGMRVILRAPGEGIVHHENVLTMIRDYAGSIDAIEVGNEPDNGASDQELWSHAWYLENVWLRCSPAAAAAHILLIAPGWQGQALPRLNSTIAGRLHDVYARFDAQAVHAYDSFVLNSPVQLRRLAMWHDWTNKPLYITEYGIAARWLLAGQPQPTSDLEKARRYADYLRAVAALPYVQAACLFLVGGTNDFAAFGGSGYDPQGNNSYWLSPGAYPFLASLLAS